MPDDHTDWPPVARQCLKRPRPMRWVVCAVFVLAMTPPAFAGDLDILRGPQPVGPALYPRWQGFYFGGQASYSDMSADFSRATGPLVAASLAELTLESQVSPSSWPVAGQGTSQVAGFGGFVGYNTQW